jgi:hypothetical protein
LAGASGFGSGGCEDGVEDVVGDGGVEGELGDGAAEGLLADVAWAVFGDLDLGEASAAAGEGLDHLDDVGGAVDAGELVLGAEGEAVLAFLVLDDVVDHDDGGAVVGDPAGEKALEGG